MYVAFAFGINFIEKKDTVGLREKVGTATGLYYIVLLGF